MTQIALDHVDKVYRGGLKALDGLNLAVADGEFMVLLGPSGCGKSTALRSIAGLEEINGGTISIGQRVANHLPPRERGIAMVSPGHALYPRMTVEQNLAFGLRLRGTPRAEIARRVARAARILGLEPYLSRHPATLSARAAAAGRDGAGDRARAARVPDGRAAIEPRRRPAGVDADGARPDARAAGRHHRVRDPRPGRGDDARGPGVRDAGRQNPAGRHPAAAVRIARQPVRGRVYRVPGDELRRGSPGPRRRADGDVRRARAPGPRRRARVPAGAGRLPRPNGDHRDPPVAFRRRRPRRRVVGAVPGHGHGDRRARHPTHAIFPVDAPPIDHSWFAGAAARNAEEDEAVSALAGGKSLWTARVSARCAPRPGQPLELVVDAGKLHFFDPATGESIGHLSARHEFAVSPLSSLSSIP